MNTGQRALQAKWVDLAQLPIFPLWLGHIDDDEKPTGNKKFPVGAMRNKMREIIRYLTNAWEISKR